MKIVKLCTVAVLAILCSLSAFAQAGNEYPAVEVSGSYAYARLDHGKARTGIPGKNAFEGFVTGTVANVNRWVGIETDFGLHQYGENQASDPSRGIVSIEQTERRLMLLSGPRFTYRRGHIEPYVHGLVGVDRASSSISAKVLQFDGSIRKATCSDLVTSAGRPVCGSNTGLAAALGGGIQITGKQVALITGLDYLITRHDMKYINASGTSSLNNVRALVGLSWRLGQRTARKH